MNSQKNLITRMLASARVFLAAGFLFTLAGAALEIAGVQPGFDTRLITGLGILLLGIGVSNWLRYRSASRDPEAARQTLIAKTDERLVILRNKAGNRGFWTGLALTYLLLMWESLSSSGSLPALSEDARWFWLAAAVVIPFLVYLASVFYEETHS